MVIAKKNVQPLGFKSLLNYVTLTQRKGDEILQFIPSNNYFHLFSKIIIFSRFAEKALRTHEACAHIFRHITCRDKSIKVERRLKQLKIQFSSQTEHE